VIWRKRETSALDALGNKHTLASKTKHSTEVVEAVKAAYDCVGVHGRIVLAPVRTAAHQGADMLRTLETAVGLALPIFQLTFFHWSWSVRLCGGPCLQPTRT